MADGTLPPEVALEQQRLTRQQQMAQALIGNNQQPQGQMIGNRYVAPSIFQNLQPVANMLAGAYIGNQADEKQLALADKLRKRESEVLGKYMTSMTPVEAKEGGIYGPQGLTTQTTADMYGPNMELNPQYKQVAPVQGRGADYKSAFEAAMDPYAPAYLKQSAIDMLKTQKLGEGETLNRFDFNTGKLVPIAEGGEKVAPEVRAAAQSLGIRGNPSTWTQQQTDAVRNQMTAFKRDTASKFDFTNMLGKSVSDVQPILIASKTATSGAIQQADAANRIIEAIDSNQLFTGAGANQKLQLAQIGQMLGVTGEKAEDKIANTRQAIQGLAQLTLQGRKQMRGEGAITESEGALAQRAMSGDVSLTASEIRQLANAAKRSGKFTYDQHQSMMGALAKDSPNSIPYYQIEVNPSIFDPINKKPAAGTSKTVNDALSIVRGSNPNEGN
jgi:hypothetical protein